AQAEEAPSPIGAAVRMVTGRGASFSAQNRPARPPPTMTTSSMPFQERGEKSALDMAPPLVGTERWEGGGGPPAVSALQIDHALHRAARPLGDHRIDYDFLLHREEGI